MISVIVIGKNEGERLVACLRSIQTALSALAHEVVYVDSCSTDQSLQTAKALGARCFLLAERKTTAGLGRFVGAKEARGEYLLFLDGDMQLQPGFAEKALMSIAAKGYDGVCGVREDVYLRGGEVVCRNDNYFGCTQERLAPGFGGALMITRDALDACGGWATDTIACEEAELYARLKAIGCRIAEIPRSDDPAHGCGARQPQSAFHRLFRASAGRRAGAGLRDEGASGARLYPPRAGKIHLYALDWLALALLALVPGFGLGLMMLIECMQLGWLLAQKRPRAFISQKLLFFGLPLGLMTLSRAQPRLCGGIIRRETAV